MKGLVKRITVAVLAVLAGTGYTVTAVDLPAPLERAAITAGLMVLTPEMEGTRFSAYPDTGGVWTICTGHTHGVRKGDTATREECDAYLRADLSSSVDFVVRKRPKVSLLCKVAIADMHVNTGPGAVGRSTLLLMAQAGDQRGAAEQFLRWVYVGGRDCRLADSNCGGIVSRRQIQRELCTVGL
jgi:lysozyme